MAKPTLIEVTLEKYGFTFYVVEIKGQHVEETLAFASFGTGLMSEMEYENCIFTEAVVNLERLFKFISTATGSEPDEQIKLRTEVAKEIYRVNPELNPDGLIITSGGLIKLAGTGDGIPLSDNPDWDKIIDDINPYVEVIALDIMDYTTLEDLGDVNDDTPPMLPFDTVERPWKRLGITLKVKKYSKDDLPFIFGPDITFKEELHYKVHIVQRCIDSAEAVFALCDATGLTEEMSIAAVTEELYLICTDVNPFLKFDVIDLDKLRKSSASKKRRVSTAKAKKGSGKKFSDITREDLLTLEERMNAKIVGQADAVSKIVDTIQVASCGLRNPEVPLAVYLMCGTTGIGKCHGKGTKVRLFDGSLKNVEDVVAGELLMGDDSQPREVLSLARGRDDMFRVVPNKGEAFTCNKAHILSLKHTTTGETVNISIEDYLKTNKNFKHLHKLYRVPVTYAVKNTLIDPYFIGLWLGDGHRDAPAVTTADPEIVDYLGSLAASEGMSLRKAPLEDNASDSYYITSGSKGGSPERNQVLNKMRLYGLLTGDGRKFIPKDYLINDRATRLSVLAGLVDSDGYLVNCTYELVFKDRQLAEDAVELARSLGFGSTVRKKEVKGTVYYRIFVSGNLEEIPVKLGRKKAAPRQQIKDVLRTGFKLEYLGHDDYYGFSITGNRLYLLRDFTVTHNTLTAKVLAEELCGSRNNLVRVDCSEYTQQHDIQKLIGAPPSYVGYEDGGYLTNAIQQNPFSVVLFDEIEKAHNKLFDLLLQIMDDARLTDGKGNVTDFRDCILLLTSNIGVTESEEVKQTMGFGDLGLLTDSRREEALNKALKNRFRPEFLNRIDETLSFRSLTKDDAVHVISLLLDRVVGYLANKDIRATFTENVRNMVFEVGFSKKFGARPLQRTIDTKVMRTLAKMLLRDEIKEGTSINVDYKDDKLVVTEVKQRSKKTINHIKA